MGLRSGLGYEVRALCVRLHQNLDLPEADARVAAHALNISLSRFRHVFKQEMGVSFARYIKQNRLQYAQKLLLATRLSVKEVAFGAGFRDVSHFVKDFKLVYGKSPSLLRTVAASNLERAANSANK